MRNRVRRNHGGHRRRT